MAFLLIVMGLDLYFEVKSIIVSQDASVGGHEVGTLTRSGLEYMCS